jgi:thymidine kinase
MTNSGAIHLIIGSMFSGKTSRLIELYYNCVNLQQSVAVINYIGDKRYHDSKLSTHDNVMIDCINTETLNEIINNEQIINSQVILINEGQFFPDIFDTTIQLAESMNKIVYICGLDGDFKRQKFGQMLDLIPYCDTITKLHAKCNNCNNHAIFSHRISTESGQIVIGTNNYVPLCRNCYCIVEKSIIKTI